MSDPSAKKKRDAFIHMVDKQYRRLIVAACRAEGGINPASADDVAQDVLEIALAQYDKQGFETNGLPNNLRGWLYKLARNEAKNHRRLFKPKVEAGADVDDAIDPTPDPEGTVQLAERRARYERHLAALPQPEKEVVLCIELYEMSFEDTATALGRPWGTVTAQFARAKKKLQEKIAESDRATAEGKRRR